MATCSGLPGSAHHCQRVHSAGVTMASTDDISMGQGQSKHRPCTQHADCTTAMSRMSGVIFTNEATEKRSGNLFSGGGDGRLGRRAPEPHLEAPMPSLTCLSLTLSCFAWQGPPWTSPTPLSTPAPRAFSLTWRPPSLPPWTEAQSVHSKGQAAKSHCSLLY